MGNDYEGITTFCKEGSAVLEKYRYAMTIVGKTQRVWMEHVENKRRSHTTALEVFDFVTFESAIPQATIHDYAQLFSDDFQADDLQKKFTRSLTDEAENGSCRLCLSARVSIASFEATFKYEFVLEPIELDRVDVLVARLRDVEGELAIYRQHRAATAEFVLTGARAFRKPNACDSTHWEATHGILWSRKNLSSSEYFNVTTDGEIVALRGGRYLIALHLDIFGCEDCYHVWLNGVAIRTIDHMRNQLSVTVFAEIPDYGRLKVVTMSKPDGVNGTLTVGAF